MQWCEVEADSLRADAGPGHPEARRRTEEVVGVLATRTLAVEPREVLVRRVDEHLLVRSGEDAVHDAVVGAGERKGDAAVLREQRDVGLARAADRPDLAGPAAVVDRREAREP